MIQNHYEQQQEIYRQMASAIDDDELALALFGKKRLNKAEIIQYFGCPNCGAELGAQCIGVALGETHRERARFAYAFLEILNK